MKKNIRSVVLTSLMLCTALSSGYASKISEDRDESAKVSMPSPTHESRALSTENADKQEHVSSSSSAVIDEEASASTQKKEKILNVMSRLNDIDSGENYLSNLTWLKHWIPPMNEQFFYMDVESAATKAKTLSLDFKIETQYSDYVELFHRVSTFAQQTPKYVFNNEELSLASSLITDVSKAKPLSPAHLTLLDKVKFYRALKAQQLAMLDWFSILQDTVVQSEALERAQKETHVLKEKESASSSSSSSSSSASSSSAESKKDEPQESPKKEDAVTLVETSPSKDLEADSGDGESAKPSLVEEASTTLVSEIPLVAEETLREEGAASSSSHQENLDQSS